MPKLTVQTPSAETISRATEISYVTDSRGRKFGLRKPSVLAQFRLVDLLGGETAKNEVYMAMIMPITWVCSIEENGEVDDVVLPSSRPELDALIQRLDEDGVLAISNELMRTIVNTAPEDVKAQAGNE